MARPAQSSLTPSSPGWRLVLFLAVVVACHQSVPARRDTVTLPPARDILARFADTTESLATPTRTYNLRTPGERDSLLAEIGRHRAAWQAAGLRDYTVLVRESCFCPGSRGWLLIEVRARAVTRVWEAPGRALPVTEATAYAVERLFDLLHQAAERDDVVEVGFDLGWHFPARIRTDTSVDRPDDWGTVEVRGLHARGR